MFAFINRLFGKRASAPTRQPIELTPEISVEIAADDSQLQKLRDLISLHGVFDEAYYLASYREQIPDGMDALTYFISKGQHLGHKPNAKFDPLLYRILKPESKETGSIAHYMNSLANGEAALQDMSTRTFFPDFEHPGRWPNVDSQGLDLKDRDLKDNLSQSEAFGQEQVLQFEVEGKTYRLVAPSADDFFNRLLEDKPCALSRLPHGFWDCLTELGKARQKIVARLTESAMTDLFSSEEIDRLAERTCYTVMSDMGVYEENFLHELLGEIAASHPDSSHMRSVSFKWQPTVDNRVFGRTEGMGPMEIEQLKSFAQYFRPETPVFESMVWKRWVYSGDISRLPVEARKRPVVLVGARRMRELDKRWKLPLFTQVEIPLLSYDQRYAVLDRCKAAVLEAKLQAEQNGTKRPLIMLQGGSFAAWLIARLHAWDPSVFYLDFGQSLHVWFLDNRDLWMPWLMFHPRLVMENCRLDEFYQDLGIVIEPPFGQSAPH